MSPMHGLGSCCSLAGAEQRLLSLSQLGNLRVFISLLMGAHQDSAVRSDLHFSEWKLHYNTFQSSWADLGVHKY